IVIIMIRKQSNHTAAINTISETQTLMNRVHSSFSRERGCCGGSLRSPGFASKDVVIHLERPFFPEKPVNGCFVLAYSCAAARDLHPLPSPSRNGGANQGLWKELGKRFRTNVRATKNQSQSRVVTDSHLRILG